VIEQVHHVLAWLHSEARRPIACLLVVRGPVGGSVQDEVRPVRLDGAHVLDEPSEAQLAHRRALGCLLIGQVAKREPQKVPVLLQRLEEVDPLARRSVLAARRHRVSLSVRRRYEGRHHSGHFLT
jgi:hypothetical protein